MHWTAEDWKIIIAAVALAIVQIVGAWRNGRKIDDVREQVRKLR